MSGEGLSQAKTVENCRDEGERYSVTPVTSPDRAFDPLQDDLFAGRCDQTS
jgi:hypothetical protein